MQISIILITLLVVTLVAAIGLFVYKPSPARGFGFSSTGNTIQLSDGRTLAYIDIGDPNGRPIFYFHGGPGSRLEGLLFDELNKQLGIRMIASDRPGFGLSDFQKDRTYLDWPGDIRELADQIGIDRFAVLGWSSGGPHAAVVARGIPQRLAVVAIAAGEGPISSDDIPHNVLSSNTFSGSRVNKLFIWSANNGAWLMRILFTVARILIFKNPLGLGGSSFGSDMSAKDNQLFARHEYIASMIEALRQGVEGWTLEYTLERRDWPFALEDIHVPKVLIFHGQEDRGVHPGIAEYMSKRIPSCEASTIYADEGHSVVYYRYEEIARALLEAWE